MFSVIALPKLSSEITYNVLRDVVNDTAAPSDAKIFMWAVPAFCLTSNVGP